MNGGGDWRDAQARKERQQRKKLDASHHDAMWSFPVKAVVDHPKFGWIVVPCQSKLAALMCAAERWGVDWTALRGANVWRYE